jgi:D-glycero-alpha-D-manno-heptose 1-phosphate guanylyltransferase
MEAIVLAGGLGTRLKSVVSDLPKCMAPVNGQPFLYYLLQDLGQKGFRHVILSLGYKHETVEQWVNALQWPFRISTVVEDSPLGTGGAIRLAMGKATEDRVFILNGDTYFHIDFHRLLLHHFRASASISIALKRMEHFDRYGTVTTDASGKILEFVEKKPCTEGYINGGIYLVNNPLSLFPDTAAFSFETEVLQQRVTTGDLYGHAFDGYFIDIGIPEDYAKADHDFGNTATAPYRKAPSPKTLFLDRDGVLNEHRPDDYVKIWDEFRFLPGVLEALPILAERYDRIVVVTNQRGVGRGLLSEDTLQDIHAQMLKAVHEGGGRIDAIYACTATNADHPLRKPNIGMGLLAKEAFPALDFSNSLMIGDSDSDIEFGLRLGTKTLKINQNGERDGLLRFALSLT